MQIDMNQQLPNILVQQGLSKYKFAVYFGSDNQSYILQDMFRHFMRPRRKLCGFSRLRMAIPGSQLLFMGFLKNLWSNKNKGS